jgi:tetratricopeptide (TPR) repeat protein
MQNRWEEAIEANKSLIESFPTDVDAYNRLGRALMELNRYSEAKEAYTKALELSPANPIAKKNLDRLAVLPRPGKVKVKEGRRHGGLTPDLFVREMGKSRLVNLYHLGPKAVLAQAVAGDQVFLHAKGKHLLVETVKKGCLGWVDPRYELRLLKLIEGGNKYAAAVVSMNADSVKVMITETYQDPSQAGKISFPEEAASVRAGKDTLLRRGVEEEALEEETPQREEGPEEEETEGLPQGFTVMENTAQLVDEIEEDEKEEE